MHETWNPRKRLSIIWNMYVITLSGDGYYIIRQEQFITLSGDSYCIIRQEWFITIVGESYYIIRQEQVITLSGKHYYIIRQHIYYIIRWSYYIIRELLHYPAVLLYYLAVIILTDDYYITNRNTPCQQFVGDVKTKSNRQNCRTGEKIGHTLTQNYQNCIIWSILFAVDSQTPFNWC